MRHIVILLIILVVTKTGHAQTYSWVDKNNILHFTDDPAQIPLSYRKKALAEAEKDTNETRSIGESAKAGLSRQKSRYEAGPNMQYFRISANVETGTPPLKMFFHLNSSFIVREPRINIQGPDQVSFRKSSNSDEYTGIFTTEGRYTVTVSAEAPDGQNYIDSKTIEVLSRIEVEALLNHLWNGIKEKLLMADASGAASYLASPYRERHRQKFAGFGKNMPSLAENMPALRLEYAADDSAKCVLIRDESIGGKIQRLAYSIYFVKEDGQWKLVKY